MLAIGNITRMRVKYEIEATWPIRMNGCSTGCPPIQVSTRRFATRSQNMIWLRGRNIIVRCFDICNEGIMAKIRMDMAKASTPPSLLGIDRRIVYANRKYHSGLIWGGVLRGLAGV